MFCDEKEEGQRYQTSDVLDAAFYLEEKNGRRETRSGFFKREVLAPMF
jgi:hypothetical protein